MLAKVRFRLWVAAIGAAITEGFGSVGVWQRSHVLSQPFLMGQTLWDTTARFHVWPWPFKVAAIWAFPAFFGGAIVMVPVNFLLRSLPEAWELLPTGVSALLLWYWAASKLEWYSPTARWAWLGTLFALSLTGAILPLGYTGWLSFGALVWCVAALLLRRVGPHAKDL